MMYNLCTVIDFNLSPLIFFSTMVSDFNLSYLIFFSTIVSDFIYINIYSIIVTSLTLIILYSGAATKLGQKLIPYLGIGASVATIYTGGKEAVKDMKGLLGTDSKPAEPSSKPTGSTPSSSDGTSSSNNSTSSKT